MKNNNLIFRSILFVLPIFLAGNFANGQNTEWITNLDVPKSALSPGQQQKLQKLENRPAFKQIQYIRLGHLPAIQKNGVLKFSIPGYPYRLTAESVRVNADSETDYKWYGKFADRLGGVTIVSKNGKVRGHIAVDDLVFEIYPLGGNISALVTVDTKEIAQQTCATPERSGEIGSTDGAPGKSSREGPCNNPVQALVFFTPAAAAADPDIEITADLAIDQFNNALINSNASSTSWIVLVGIQEFNMIENPNNIDGDVDIFATDPNILALRDQFNADLMLLITDGDYVTNTFPVGGAARAIGPDNASAFALADLPNATSTYTTAHEIGHLFGARHQDCAHFLSVCDDNPPAFAHGYSFTYGLFNQNKCSCLMHVMRPGYTRIPNFSNPGVSIGGEPTGTAAGHDNARLLDENSLIVAQFQPSNDNLGVWIDGPTSVSSFGGRTYEAVFSCGQGPYTFQWAFSFDGFTFFNDGTGEFYTYFFTTNQNVYIRVTVNSNDGQQTNNTTFVNVNIPTGSRLASVHNQEKEIIKLPKSIHLGDAFPNPSRDKTFITFALPVAQNVKLELLDFRGRLVQSLAEGSYKAGQHVKEFSSSTLREGLYFYRLSTGSFVQTKKLLLTNGAQIQY